MRTVAKRVLFWTPRILCILFAVFISLFALDVLGEGYTPGRTALALAIHLVPTAVIVLVLVLSWRREWIGAVVYVALGILYVVLAWSRFPWPAYVLISGPLILIGILFLVNWMRRAELRLR